MWGVYGVSGCSLRVRSILTRGSETWQMRMKSARRPSYVITGSFKILLKYSKINFTQRVDISGLCFTELYSCKSLGSNHARLTSITVRMRYLLSHRFCSPFIGYASSWAVKGVPTSSFVCVPHYCAQSHLNVVPDQTSTQTQRLWGSCHRVKCVTPETNALCICVHDLVNRSARQTIVTRSMGKRPSFVPIERCFSYNSKWQRLSHCSQRKFGHRFWGPRVIEKFAPCTNAEFMHGPRCDVKFCVYSLNNQETNRSFHV